MADQKMYAWTTIYNGGETEMVRDRKIIHSRSIIRPGEAVTKSGLKLDDDQWDALVAGGSVRPYKFPDMPADFDGSVSDFVMQKLRDDDGEIDQDVLLGLAMTVHGDALTPEQLEERAAVEAEAEKSK